MQQFARPARHTLIESAVGMYVSLDSVRANHAEMAAAAGLVRPLLVHVHIPKCAGSSFNDLLRRTVGPEFHLDMYSTVPRSVIPVEALAEQLRAAPNVRSAMSHSIRLVPNVE